MVKQASKRDLAWAYAAQLLNLGAGILLLPFALYFLSAELVGVWYVFLALASFAQLLEFGFQPTIARQTAYVYAGAENLTAHGLPQHHRTELNLALLAELVTASRNVYRWIALGAMLILFAAGSYYLSTLKLTLHDFSSAVLIPWLIYSAGSVLNFYFGYYNGLLQGRGDQTSANRIVALSRGFMVLISIPLLIAGLGLMALAIANMASAALSRFLASKSFFNESNAEAAYLRANKQSPSSLTTMLWQSSWRLGLVHFGAFLCTKANLFIASSYLGLTAAASYGLTMQLLALLGTTSAMMSTLQLPRMNLLQSRGGLEELRSLYSTSLIFSWVAYGIGGMILIFGSEPILALFRSNASLIARPWLVCLVAIMFLEMNHSISATYLTTLNKIPFVKAALLSGISIIVVSLLFVHSTALGIGSLVLSQGLVQLTYNNWKWPHIASRHLSLSFAHLLNYGFIGIKRLARR